MVMQENGTEEQLRQLAPLQDQVQVARKTQEKEGAGTIDEVEENNGPGVG